MLDQLVPKIPLIEAAEFFYRIKHAGWEEAPDMSGTLEGQFAAPVEQVLAQLTKVITAKFRKVVAYYTYGESMRDLSQRSIRMILFYEHAEDELKAVEYYLKRAAVLGGAVHLDSIEPPPASTDPIHIIQTMIRAEQEAIAEQRHLRDLAGEDNSLKVGVEEQLVKDQHHLDELWQLLPSELHQEVQNDPAVVALPGEAGSEAVPAASPAGPAAGPSDKTAGLISELSKAQHPERRAEGIARVGELLSGARAKRLSDAVGKAKQDISGLKGAAELARRDAGKAKSLTAADALHRQAAGHENAAAALSSKAQQHRQDLHGVGRKSLGESTKVLGARVGAGAVGVSALNSYAAGKKKESSDRTPPTDAELKETGRQRAVTQLAGEAHRERGRRGERLGDTLGRAAGALGGAAAGHRFIGGRLGTVAGLAAGYGAGGKAGRELGAERDIHKNAAASLTPDETEALQQYRTANHLYLDPMLAMAGYHLGAGSGHPGMGLLGGAGLGALLSHTVNRRLDKTVETAQSGKMQKAEQRLHRQAGDGTTAPLIGGLLGGIHGGILGESPVTALMGGAAGVNLGAKGIKMHRTLADVAGRAGQVPDDLGVKAAAMRFKLASTKLAFGPDVGTYMAANQAGQQAQEQAEADFYREKVRAMEQASGASQQQLADMQAQLQQLQEQTAQSGAAIQAASQEASMARDDALAQTQAAANMRIGYQKLRQMIIDAASQDPETMAGGLPGDLPPGSGNGIDPAMQPGMPGASPEATAPNAVPAEAGGPGAPGAAQNASGKAPGPAADAQPSSVLKTAAPRLRLLENAGAIAGGLVGAGLGAHSALKPGREHDARAAAVVDAVQNRTAGDSADVARKLVDYDEAAKTKAHPVRTALRGGLGGAFLGSMAGDQLQRLGRNIRSIP